MSETTINVSLIAHTRFSEEFLDSLWQYAGYSDGVPDEYDDGDVYDATDGQGIALTAIRTCYSPLKPSQIINVEKDKYFGNVATDGGIGKESDRLFRHIVASGHTSTLEHITFTFAIEGVSRALLAQLTRHRVGFSFSVQSQRYVKLGSNDKSGGFDYVMPETIHNSTKKIGLFGNSDTTVSDLFELVMKDTQVVYDMLREAGIPSEDARAILPNATATNLVMTVNLRALLDFYGKRRKGRGAQAEIANLAERLRECVVAVEPWTDQFFEVA